MENSDTKLIILTTVFNCQEWIGKCIESVKGQTFSNFECYLLDDMSTDSSVDIAKKAIGDDDRFHVIINSKKFYQAGNYDQVIRSHNHVNDQDIIVEVDGDDWLPDSEVFSRVVKAYSDGETWLTCGQFEYSDGRKGFSRPGKVETCRTAVFTMSHLRSWKAFLWRSLKVEDLYYSTGWYAESGGDQYFMLPMFEMATERHTKFLEEVNYIYNEENPLNDHKKDLNAQITCAQYARSLPSYCPLNLTI